jgi:hypothetical protein
MTVGIGLHWHPQVTSQPRCEVPGLLGVQRQSDPQCALSQLASALVDQTLQLTIGFTLDPVAAILPRQLAQHGQVVLLTELIGELAELIGHRFQGGMLHGSKNLQLAAQAFGALAPLVQGGVVEPARVAAAHRRPLR